MTHEDELTLPTLRVLSKVDDGKLSTTQLRRAVKNEIRLKAGDLDPIKGRPDFRIDQTIRNIKSHKKSPGNPFFEGYLQDIPKGFKITTKGRKFIE